MKISLLMPTLNRIEEIKVLLESLEKQTYRNFELIIIDQNQNEKISNLLRKKRNFKIKYIKSDTKGLSFNRNLGLKYCTGDIITLTDDDAEYPEVLFEKIIQEFKNNLEINILSVRTKEKNSNKTIHKSPMINTAITKKNIFKTAISFTVFIKYKKITDIYFDEQLGVGAKFGSGEESDMLLSLLHQGYKGKYIYGQELVVYHPYKDEVSNPERFYLYALGLGAVLKKEIILRRNKSYILILIKSILKPLIGMLIYLFYFEKYQKYKNILIGRIDGFKNYIIKK